MTHRKWKEGHYFCEKCQKEIKPDRVVELELNSKTGKYFIPGKVPIKDSQGCFYFGRNCAATMFKNGEWAVI
jgi:hypothetical protein